MRLTKKACKKEIIDQAIIGNGQQSDILTLIYMPRIIASIIMKIVSYSRRKPSVTEVDQKGNGKIFCNIWSGFTRGSVLDYQLRISIEGLKISVDVKEHKVPRQKPSI